MVFAAGPVRGLRGGVEVSVSVQRVFAQGADPRASQFKLSRCWRQRIARMVSLHLPLVAIAECSVVTTKDLGANGAQSGACFLSGVMVIN